MGLEIWQNPTCTLCGTKKGGYGFYHGAKDKDLYLCSDCLKSAAQSLTYDQLSGMTTGQFKRHMEVRDELAAAYKSSFTATRTFCIGNRKKRDIPVLEVDEKRGLWALPRAPMPLAQSIASIADVEVTLSSDEIADEEELEGEIVKGLTLKDLMPVVRSFISSRYKSKHTDLAPIPEGHYVSYLKMVLTLDDHESGIGKAEIDLLPYLISWPSRTDAGYDCAYEIIEFLKQLASSAYKRGSSSRGQTGPARNDRLAILAARKLMSDEDAEIIRYYLDRVPWQGKTGGAGTSYGLAKTVIDTVGECILFGEKSPEWMTQHTVGTDAFLGAFYRYAPGLSIGDVVCIMDKTRLQSGKGGILFAQDGFAADDFSLNLGESAELVQPIRYDDLLFVGRGKGKGKLVLAYRDGRRIEVNGGQYAHYIFAAANCILLLRSS
ncbi:MAG: hypothetical protein J6D34_04070 [Atopobiaceae bacterium]|nr:hypothetical protein [Atopobiaceae bacterium]